MRRSFLTKGVAPALAVLLCLLSASSGSAAGGWTRTQKIAPGVVYTSIKDPQGPYRIRVVSIDLSQSSTIDVALGTDKLPGWERTSDIARRFGAIAAINGDYGRESGRPVMTFARDGVIDQSPLVWGRNFAVDRTETATHIGHPELSTWAYVPDSGAQYPIERFNAGIADIDELAAFSPVGGSEEKPSPYSCSARLLSSGPVQMSASSTPETPNYVDAVRCKSKPLARRGGTVLTTPLGGTRESEITGLLEGQQVNVGWSLGWPGVMDTLGGNPTLIEGGQIVPENVYGSGSFFKRHPRTGVGTTPDGRVLFVTVDGRRPRYSVGMTLGQFARFFKSQGADYALNLDGGGSTTMVVNGDVVNRPSDDKGERPVSSALLLLPGPDAGEPFPQPTPSPSPTVLPPIVPPEEVPGGSTWDAVVNDPASTGGLAHMLQSEGFKLPRFLERAAATFAQR